LRFVIAKRADGDADESADGRADEVADGRAIRDTPPHAPKGLTEGGGAERGAELSADRGGGVLLSALALAVGPVQLSPNVAQRRRRHLPEVGLEARDDALVHVASLSVARYLNV